MSGVWGRLAAGEGMNSLAGGPAAGGPSCEDRRWRGCPAVDGVDKGGQGGRGRRGSRLEGAEAGGDGEASFRVWGEGVDDGLAGLLPLGGVAGAAFRAGLDGGEDAGEEGEVAAGLADGGEHGAGIAAVAAELEG